MKKQKPARARNPKWGYVTQVAGDSVGVWLTRNGMPILPGSPRFAKSARRLRRHIVWAERYCAKQNAKNHYAEKLIADVAARPGHR